MDDDNDIIRCQIYLNLILPDFIFTYNCVWIFTWYLLCLEHWWLNVALHSGLCLNTQKLCRIFLLPKRWTASFIAPLDFNPLAAAVLKSDASSSSLPVVVSIMDIDVLENSETIFGNSSSHDSAVDVGFQTTTVTILGQAGGRTSGWANMAESMWVL